jgi:hypothetical protein
MSMTSAVLVRTQAVSPALISGIEGSCTRWFDVVQIA